MRHQTHANRICHGTPLFVTFSPSERDNTLMLRLARARQNDPSLREETETNRAAQGRSKPELDVEFFSLSPEALAAELPPYDDRRAMLTKDPLACADGFRTLVQLALRHLFGVRYCPRCPDCGNAKEPCTDAFGSNAMACGGIFGRIDAASTAPSRAKSRGCCTSTSRQGGGGGEPRGPGPCTHNKAETHTPRTQRDKKKCALAPRAALRPVLPPVQAPLRAASTGNASQRESGSLSRGTAPTRPTLAARSTRTQQEWEQGNARRRREKWPAYRDSFDWP